MARYDLGDCNLPKIFHDLGVTNQDFAEKMKMSRQQASNTIRGKKKMNTPLLLSVAKTYDIDPMEIYDLIPVKKDEEEQSRAKSTN